MARPTHMLRLIKSATTPSRNKGPHAAEYYNLRISCKVKPNTAENREGIAAVGPEKVDVCVAASPRNGEANAAVSRVFAQAFGVAKSDVVVVHGLKSRDKVLNIINLDIGKESKETFLVKARQRLQDGLIK
ncbi:hypothetical protein BJX64DRAFT_285103 [Aspergillus heterothallicus]